MFIDLVEEGVYWADAEGCGVVPAIARTVLDMASAGDAMGAAMIHGCVQGLSTEECARLGAQASAEVFQQEA